MNKKRIFWLGMHKLLTRTELPALRDMGYEVFNPPYLSDIQDQSAELDWFPSESTLPEAVYAKLATYNFFYNSIDNKIAEILNEYFDVVIVTINPDWLLSILEVFKKTVIYRTYGQPGTVSEGLLHNGCYRLIQERDDFWFVPHCAETAADEQAWLIANSKISPYWLENDVFSFRGQWRNRYPKKVGIGLTCPNISNAYYKAHFNYLKGNFEQRFFRYYGVQIEENADPNVVGTLSRDRYLEEFLSLSGYLYTYREPNVCYLPPIEMMVLGGPVLYFPGSLLHRYFSAASPGLVRDEKGAHEKVKLLLKGDTRLISEIVNSQEKIVERYSRNYGLPIFSRVFSEIIEKPDVAISKQNSIIASPTEIQGSESPPVLLYAHIRGAYTFSNGEFSTIHGIPRVMRQLVRALTCLNIHVVVTAWHDDVINTHGFYSSACDNPDLVTVIPVGDELSRGYGAARNLLKSIIRRSSALRNIRDRYVHNPSGLSPLEFKLIELYKNVLAFQGKVNSASARLKAWGLGFASWAYRVMRKNTGSSPTNASSASLESKKSEDKWRYVIIPHYYLFPDALTAGYDRILAYIPDYIPHFFKGRDYFPEEKSHVELGQKLVNMSTLVLTNSKFTAGYLPKSALAVPEDKIVSFPMPFLGTGKEGEQYNLDYRVENELFDRKYIFYPTQPHPNKRLDLLVRAFIAVNKLRPDLDFDLVLTSGDIHPALRAMVTEENLASRMHLIPEISDQTLSWLYKNALCLAFTSELEGNFPTQILEALHYRCPVVAMENPLITSELGDLSRKLCLAPFADIESFSNLIIFAIENKDEVLSNQEDVLSFVKRNNSFDIFTKNVIELDRRLRKPSHLSG